MGKAFGFDSYWQAVWERVSLQLLMLCWEIIQQRQKPCWYRDSLARPSAITSTHGNGEEINLWVNAKESKNSLWDGTSRTGWCMTCAQLCSAGLTSSFIPETSGEAQWFNSSAVININFDWKSNLLKFTLRSCLVLPSVYCLHFYLLFDDKHSLISPVQEK